MYEMIKKTKTSETIQCVRKRVSGSSDPIDKSDLFYDKSDGKYYTNMREIGFRKDCQIYYDEYRAYSKETLKDRSPHTVLLAELSDKTAYIKSPRLQESVAAEQAPPASGPRPTYTREAPRYSGTLVSAGIEETVLPPIARLYSEAEMTHASTLARTMTSAARYNAFREIGYEDLPDVRYLGGRAPLIKATEFDDRVHVMARYSSKQQYKGQDAKDAFTQGRILAAKHRRDYGDLGCASEEDRIIVEEGIINDVIREITAGIEGALQEDERGAIKREIKAEIMRALAGAGADGQEPGEETKKAIMVNFKKGYIAVSKGCPALKKRLDERENLSPLEVSYGGATGDMTSLHGVHARQRKYDIIQSTFFWMPGVSSLDNARAMLNFFVAQYQKLNPGGIIRLVSFSNNAEQKDRNRSWEEDEKQYGKAAEWVYGQLKRKIYYTDVRKTLLYEDARQRDDAGREGKPYSKELSERGLNPSRDNSPLYRPLWTDINKVVGAGGEKNGNLILQARKRRIFRP